MTPCKIAIEGFPDRWTAEVEVGAAQRIHLIAKSPEEILALTLERLGEMGVLRQRAPGRLDQEADMRRHGVGQEPYATGNAGARSDEQATAGPAVAAGGGGDAVSAGGAPAAAEASPAPAGAPNAGE